MTTEMQYMCRIEALADENGQLREERDEAVREYSDLDAWAGKVACVLAEVWPWARAAMPRGTAAKFEERMRALHVGIEEA